ncbi:hypothetical protein E2C01_046866 [Portunus trituberculatus]|uniref:Uncharacterized protein n=1 Tax=Portunus trituberculatus TaxID=210409 RepID=A0A5B7G8X6_PORTR|nr:hypothetical protein [Portunus trituberculatus]
MCWPGIAEINRLSLAPAAEFKRLNRTLTCRRGTLNEMKRVPGMMRPMLVYFSHLHHTTERERERESHE